MIGEKSENCEVNETQLSNLKACSRAKLQPKSSAPSVLTRQKAGN